MRGIDVRQARKSAQPESANPRKHTACGAKFHKLVPEIVIGGGVGWGRNLTQVYSGVKKVVSWKQSDTGYKIWNLFGGVGEGNMERKFSSHFLMGLICKKKWNVLFIYGKLIHSLCFSKTQKESQREKHILKTQNCRRESKGDCNFKYQNY